MALPFAMGCAIWAYPQWVGELYPPGSRSGQLLSLYSQRFHTVEGNTTFYSVPDAQTVARWRRNTQDGFQFCLKLPRSLTHAGTLQPQLPATLTFLEQMQPLGDRLGPFFAQLPPSYGPHQLPDLAAFLQELPRSLFEFALEVRHPNWFREPQASALDDLLRSLGVGRVLLDTRPIYDCPDNPQLRSERQKPRLPLQPSVTAAFSLIRYISHPDLALNQPYWQEWTRRIAAWLGQGTRIYYFVHCPLEVRSPRNARHFYHQLQQQGISVPPLPWDLLEPPPAQLNLFEQG